MPAAALHELLDKAFADRYGVAAFNVVNDLSMRAVIQTASELGAPVIVQTSVKTVRLFGASVLAGMFHI